MTDTSRVLSISDPQKGDVFEIKISQTFYPYLIERVFKKSVYLTALESRHGLKKGTGTILYNKEYFKKSMWRNTGTWTHWKKKGEKKKKKLEVLKTTIKYPY